MANEPWKLPNITVSGHLYGTTKIESTLYDLKASYLEHASCHLDSCIVYGRPTFRPIHFRSILTYPNLILPNGIG